VKRGFDWLTRKPVDKLTGGQDYRQIHLFTFSLFTLSPFHLFDSVSQTALIMQRCGLKRLYTIQKKMNWRLH